MSATITAAAASAVECQEPGITKNQAMKYTCAKRTADTPLQVTYLLLECVCVLKKIHSRHGEGSTGGGVAYRFLIRVRLQVS